MKKFSVKKAFFYVVALIVALPNFVFAQWNVQDNSGAGLPKGSIAGIIVNFMNWILGIVGTIGIIGFAIAGIWYLTAAGDDSRMEKGKNAMIWSITGVIVALMGYVIIQAADAFLNSRAMF